MNWKIGMADGWRQLHKRGTVIVSGSLALVTACGPAIIEAWNQMPQDLNCCRGASSDTPHSARSC